MNKMNQKIQKFKEKAGEIHNGKYDYSLVKFTKTRDIIDIICPSIVKNVKHGVFKMRVETHLKGGMCPRCRVLKTMKYTYDDFIEKANNMHDNQYDYSCVEFHHVRDKIKIKCNVADDNKVHGVFEMSVATHLKGSGCPKCRGKISRKKVTQEEFIRRAYERHGNKYDYSKTKYVKTNIKVSIICNVIEDRVPHGVFKQTPNAHISAGYGCPKCGSNRAKSREEFIDDAIKIHGTEYDYSSTEYINNASKVKIICHKKSNGIEHGVFEPYAGDHLKGKKCFKCTQVKMDKKHAAQKKKFIDKAIEIYGNARDFSHIEYINYDTKVKIVCNDHGIYEQTPHSLISGNEGCRKCSTKGYSRKQIEWLNNVAKEDNIEIMHAINGGEYKVGKYKVDGYCRETNTVYEFHGDYWHGNPKKYHPNKKNVINGKTMRELYKRTIEKDNYIKRKGYNLIVMWEYDYDNNL